MSERGNHVLWTPTDIRRAAEIWQRDFADHHGDGDGPWGAQGEVFATIAQATRKTLGSVAGRFERFGPSFTAGPRGGGPTEQAYADLERRNAARHRQDLTASVFGDPPPGFSALDKRRHGARP